MTCFRCEELERILGLRQEFPLALGLSKTMQRVLGVLLKRDFISGESLFTIVWGEKPESDQPESKLVAVYISKLRAKLKPHGIEIKTRWGQGFYMEPESKKRLRDLCASREAA